MKVSYLKNSILRVHSQLDGKMIRPQMNEYLLKEYELCFEQLRFYDTRQESLLKYFCSLTVAVATAIFAIYRAFNGATDHFFDCALFLAGMVFLASLLLIGAMLQNRLYFVFVARQLNTIRGHMMKTAAPQFKGNQMYTSSTFPALKLFSVHTIELVGTAFMSSAFAGLSMLASMELYAGAPNKLAVVCTFVLVFALEVSGSMFFLHKKGKKSSDQAIHSLKFNAEN